MFAIIPVGNNNIRLALALTLTSKDRSLALFNFDLLCLPFTDSAVVASLASLFTSERHDVQK